MHVPTGFSAALPGPRPRRVRRHGGGKRLSACAIVTVAYVTHNARLPVAAAALTVQPAPADRHNGADRACSTRKRVERADYRAYGALKRLERVCYRPSMFVIGTAGHV